MNTNVKYQPAAVLSDLIGVSPVTIRGWAKRGHIPRNTFIKAGNTYLFDVPAVMDALRGEEPTQEDENPPVQLELDLDTPQADPTNEDEK